MFGRAERPSNLRGSDLGGRNLGAIGWAVLDAECDGIELPDELLGASGRIGESADIACVRARRREQRERNQEREQLCARKKLLRCEHGMDIWIVIGWEVHLVRKWLAVSA